MFKPILLTSLTGIYWFPCLRSHVQTRFLQSQSCLFVFINHLATQSSRELSQTIATYTHFYHVVEVFPATQTPLSFHPVAIITKVEKGPSPCLSPLGEPGLWKSCCSVFFLVFSPGLDFCCLERCRGLHERSSIAAGNIWVQSFNLGGLTLASVCSLNMWGWKAKMPEQFSVTLCPGLIFPELLNQRREQIV